MARKTKSRLELRKQAEAAEQIDQEVDGDDEQEMEIELEADSDSDSDGDDDDDAPKKKKKKAVKKKAAPRAKRTKAKAVVRKRLVWGVFSSSMKEEGRFAYADREAAENRAKALAEKNKRTYFVQGIKEPIADAPAPAAK